MVLDILADSSLLYKHSATTENERERERERERRECVWEKGFLLVWLLDIYGLQFEIVREVLLPLGFSFVVWWFALSWCIATFGFDLWLFLWFVRNWYLTFCIRIWYLWTFGSLIHIWFFGFVFVRESYLGVFGIWVYESISTPICIISNLS